MRGVILSLVGLLLASSGASAQDKISEADSRYVLEHRPELEAAVGRFKQLLQLSINDHLGGCVALGRYYDESTDVEPVKRTLSIYFRTSGNAPAFHSRYVEAERAGDYAWSCATGYVSAIVLKALGRDADAEVALGYGRRGLSHVAQAAALAAAPPSSPAGLELKTEGQAAGRRVALLIANAHYQSSTGAPSLRTPLADVALMAQSLKQAGFSDVTVVQDLGRREMADALRRFEGKAGQADTALIYYAGHGLQAQGENYAVPIDAHLSDEQSVVDEAVSQERLMAAMSTTHKLKILVMDACRDRPLNIALPTERAESSVGTGAGQTTRSLSRGLVRIIPPKSHSVVVYSAGPGQTAQDGSGADSPFAAALAHRILQPGVEIDLMLRQVASDVSDATHDAQRPNIAGNLGADPFFFVPPG